jgi:hypothetical protein
MHPTRDEVLMKTCTKCHVYKPLAEFHVNRRNADGLQCWCKNCRRQHASATHDIEKHRKYRSEHAAEIRERKRKYRETHREQEAARVSAWHASNPERVREHKRRYQQKHAGITRQSSVRWVQENRQRVRDLKNAREKRIREAAGPSYAAKVLRIRKTEAAPELLEMKRDQLLMHRLITDLKKAIQGEQT